jgi:hypothetical protein
LRELVDVERRIAERVKASTPANVWSRLNAIDLMNSSMVFPALAVLCLLPSCSLSPPISAATPDPR